MGRSRIYLDHEGIERDLPEHEGWLAAEVRDGPGEAPRWSDAFTNAEIATGRYRPTCECGWLGPEFDGHDPTSPWTPTQLWPDTDGQPDPLLPDEIQDELMATWQAHTDAIVGVNAIGDAAYAARVAEDRLGSAIATARAAGTSWEVIGRQLQMTETEAEERYSHYRPPEPEPAIGPTDPQWWNDLGESLSQAALRNEDLAVADGLITGNPKISRGRSTPGWEEAACQAMATSLDRHDFEILEVVDSDQLDLEGSWRAPIGGIRIAHDATTVLLGVRVDDVGEIYASVDDPADPRAD